MFQGHSNLLTETSEIFSFGISRLEETNSDLFPKLFVRALDFFEKKIKTKKRFFNISRSLRRKK